MNTCIGLNILMTITLHIKNIKTKINLLKKTKK